MSTYVISDIHGCFDEFQALLEQIQFNPDRDVLYILGDVVDRGPKPLNCLRFIMQTKSVHLLRGNHEDMMFDFLDRKSYAWERNGSGPTQTQLIYEATEKERDAIYKYLRKRPLYKTVGVNGKRYFLSHAGLNPQAPFNQQSTRDLVWNRKDFYENKALPRHICIFGHTPTMAIRDNRDCSVWFDEEHKDKICIDAGCVFGGALAALRLDDYGVFYVKSSEGNFARYHFDADQVVAEVFATSTCPQN